MDQLKKNIVFYLLLLMDFYIVPWFIKDTGSAMLVMLVVIPLICFIISFFYGIRNGFDLCYIGIVAVMFAPSIFIFNTGLLHGFKDVALGDDEHEDRDQHHDDDTG